VPEDGAAVQVATDVGGLGTDVVARGTTVALAGTGVGDADWLAVAELAGDGADVKDEVAVTGTGGVTLLVPIEAVEVGDEGKAPVPVGEGIAVSEGTAVG